MRELKLLSVIALLEDVSDHKLLRGQLGTVVARTLLCPCALINCFNFITSRAITRLEYLDPHFPGVRGYASAG